MSKKRIVSLTFILAMAMVLLVACGDSGGSKTPSNNPPPSSGNNQTPPSSDNNKTEDLTDEWGDTGGLKLPIVDKPTTITWMLVGEQSVEDKLIVKEIEKRTGITLDIQTVPGSGFQEKLRVTLGSGKLPDIFHGLRPAELKKLGQEGGVVAINDYADMLPNFTKLYMEENDWVVRSYGDENGKMYTWPIYNMNRDVNHGFLYRKDIFDQHGIPEWTDTDGFYDALKQLKDIYPESYPYASKNTANIFRDWAYGWGIGGTDYPMYYDESDKKWKFAATSPENLDMLQFMKTLYNEGLIDQEFLTDTADSWTAKMTTDQSFVTFDWIGRLDLFYNQVSSANPDYDLRYANPVGPTGNIRTLPKVDANWGITVANNDNAEVALKLLDYLTSPSGAALVTLGVEGETFNFDSEGNLVYPELTDLPLVDIKVLEDRYGLWLEGMYLAPDRRSVYYNFTEKEQEAQDKMISQKKFEPLDPVLNFTDEESSRIADLQTSLVKATEEFNTLYVLDKNYGHQQWEEWQSNANRLGAQELVDIYNAAQARYDAQ